MTGYENVVISNDTLVFDSMFNGALRSTTGGIVLGSRRCSYEFHKQTVEVKR